MTFTEARKTLQRLADGDYCSMEYKLTMDCIEEAVICAVYTHTYKWHDGPTWEIALEKLKMAMDGIEPESQNIEADLSEAPDV